MLVPLTKFTPPLLIHLLLDSLCLEREKHLFVGLSIQFCLVFLAFDLVICTLLESNQILLPLELVQGLSLLFNHVTMRKWEVIYPLNGL